MNLTVGQGHQTCSERIQPTRGDFAEHEISRLSTSNQENIHIKFISLSRKNVSCVHQKYAGITLSLGQQLWTFSGVHNQQACR